MTDGSSRKQLQGALDAFRGLLTPQELSELSNTPAPSGPTGVLQLVSEIDKRKTRRRIGVRFKKFLDSVQQFANIVDTYIQADPTVAALVWGSVKFVILMAVNFGDYFEKIADMYRNLGDLCPTFEQLQTLFPESQRLRELLEQFYALVIDFCGDVLKFLRKNRKIRFNYTGALSVHERMLTQWKAVKQLGKSLWKPFKIQYGEIYTQFEEQEEKIRNEVLICSETAAHRERQEMILYRREARLHRAHQANWMLQDDIKAREQKREALLGKISDYDYQSTFEYLRFRRHGETNSWLRQIAVFEAWLQDSRPCGLWIYGKPGSGKSTLATAAVDLLVNHHQASSSRTSINYFFCDFNSACSLNAQTVLSTLIRQILSLLTFQEIPETLQADLERLFGNKYRRPDPRELFGILQMTAELFERTYLIIDGLDECPDDDLSCLVAGLVQLIRSSTKLKFIILSRHHINISNLASDLRVLALDSIVKRGDIALYVEDELKQRVKDKRLCVKDHSLLEEIKQVLCNDCEGMVLWITFQFDDICRQITDNAIREVLKSLPRGLDATYKRIVDRIARDHDSKIAKKIFGWLSNVRRRLMLAELREAVAVELGDLSWYESSKRFANDPHKMLHNCGALVNYNDVDKKVQFAHKTVVDFLRSNLCPLEFLIDEKKSEIQVAEICLTYLSFADFQTALVRAPVSTKPTALDAPISSWIPHIAGSDATARLVRKILVDVRQIFSKTDSDATVAQYLPYHKPQQSIENPLESLGKKLVLLGYIVDNWLHHLSAITPADEECWSLMRHVLNRRFVFDHVPWQEDVQEEFPYRGQYSWAIENIHPQVLGQTLEILKSAQKHRIRTYSNIMIGQPPDLPLIFVCRKGSDTCLDTLLVSGADVHVTGEHGLTALQWAAKEGHLAVVNRLLDANVSVNAADDKGGTALQWAAKEGHVAVVDRLLATNVDINAADDDGGTALQWAAKEGHLAVVNCLLDANVNVNAADNKGGTALQWAAKEGHVAVVDRLLATNVDINAADDDGGTALQWAAKEGHLAVVDRLLAAKADGKINAADVNAGTHDVWNALRHAADGEHLAVFGRLLAASDGVSTALHWAARKGYLTMVNQLLAASIDATIDDKIYLRTALYEAVEGGDAAVMHRLLAANADATFTSGSTALHWAAEEGYLAMIDFLLLASMVDVDGANDYGWTALHCAAARGYLTVVDRLLAANADVNVADGRGWTALHCAVVDRLLAANADVNVADGKGSTAFHRAAEEGHLAVVDRLLAANADVNVADGEGWTALHCAAARGYLTVVDRLLAANFDVNVADRQDWTALHLAAATGHLAVVDRLLAANFDVNVADRQDWTALHWAAYRGHLAVVDRLLAANADVNAADGKGSTALRRAAARGHLAVVDRLLAANTDVNAKTTSGDTALDKATTNGNSKVVQRLRKAGAKK